MLRSSSLFLIEGPPLAHEGGDKMARGLDRRNLSVLDAQYTKEIIDA
jgi:hypothetical protein